MSSSTFPWGASAARRPSASTPGNEEVGVLRHSPELLVTHRAADEVRVERERAHVVLDRLHGQRYARAMASISTSAPAGSLPTSTVERAGGVAPMWLA